MLKVPCGKTYGDDVGERCGRCGVATDEVNAVRTGIADAHASFNGLMLESATPTTSTVTSTTATTATTHTKFEVWFSVVGDGNERVVFWGFSRNANAIQPWLETTGMPAGTFSGSLPSKHEYAPPTHTHTRPFPAI
jgi:hypothetical protein